MSKTITSIQIKVYECQIKELKPCKSIFSFEVSSDEDSESDDEEYIKKLVLSDMEVDE